jgi:hypothetical protein
MIWMRLGITQLFPDVWQRPEKDVPNGIIHVMVRPSTCLPAKFALLGIDLYGQPIDDRIVGRTGLQKRVVGLDIDIYLPNPSVTAWIQLAGERIPPPLTGVTHSVIERLAELTGEEIL